MKTQIQMMVLLEEPNLKGKYFKVKLYRKFLSNKNKDSQETEAIPNHPIPKFF